MPSPLPQSPSARPVKICLDESLEIWSGKWKPNALELTRTVMSLPELNAMLIQLVKKECEGILNVPLRYNMHRWQHRSHSAKIWRQHDLQVHPDLMTTEIHPFLSTIPASAWHAVTVRYTCWANWGQCKHTWLTLRLLGVNDRPAVNDSWCNNGNKKTQRALSVSKVLCMQFNLDWHAMRSMHSIRNTESEGTGRGRQ